MAAKGESAPFSPCREPAPPPSGAVVGSRCRADNRASMRRSRLERLLVSLIAAHSAAVGAALLFAPAWSARFGGFGAPALLFFARQAGAFHFVVALGYLGELRRYGGVSLLVATKCIAVLFLLGMWLAGETAWAVPLSALADGLMALAVVGLHRLVLRERASAAGSV